jgi:hypothetical protein
VDVTSGCSRVAASICGQISSLRLGASAVKILVEDDLCGYVWMYIRGSAGSVGPLDALNLTKTPRQRFPDFNHLGENASCARAGDVFAENPLVDGHLHRLNFGLRRARDHAFQHVAGPANRSAVDVTNGRHSN